MTPICERQSIVHILDRPEPEASRQMNTVAARHRWQFDFISVPIHLAWDLASGPWLARRTVLVLVLDK